MRYTKLKKIENKVRKETFYTSYRLLDIILYVLSFFGNLASIFLASFYFSKILKETITDIQSPYFIWGVTITLLIALELLKREIFHRFSKEILRYKTIFNGEGLLLSIFSILIISMSFYASLSGAKEFSSKNELIQKNTTLVVDNYKDSMNKIYEFKIEKIEKENIAADKRIENQDAMLMATNSQRDKRRIDKEINNIRKDKEINNSKIKELKLECDKIIEKYEANHISKSVIEIDKNKDNSSKFVKISTIIEIFILFGIFFNTFYNFVSYNTMRSIIIAKASNKTWLLYNELLDHMISNKVTTLTGLLELCVFNDIHVTESQLKEFLKLLDGLGIFSANKFILNQKEAEDKLNEYFKIR